MVATNHPRFICTGYKPDQPTSTCSINEFRSLLIPRHTSGEFSDAHTGNTQLHSPGVALKALFPPSLAKSYVSRTTGFLPFKYSFVCSDCMPWTHRIRHNCHKTLCEPSTQMTGWALRVQAPCKSYLRLPPVKVPRLLPMVLHLVLNNGSPKFNNYGEVTSYLTENDPLWNERWNQLTRVINTFLLTYQSFVYLYSSPKSKWQITRGVNHFFMEHRVAWETA